jgi:hypothetical protein
LNLLCKAKGFSLKMEFGYIPLPRHLIAARDIDKTALNIEI